ncbi:NTE family protein [Rhodanobacter sp. ANJX3]|uniref:patatin-like phospholipase family protein n=1 Tax=Rhodanobacter sp. ANJX3 TaxID=2723083 RepID=UPI0016132E26|nr:patatin-like phospholipase family protein [Rhodanobacter sp. ANJX3]MBB5357641.1 NTE family protein [Rhodanobacter sp. ANJX3]
MNTTPNSPDAAMSRALVLGGGGAVGRAWQTGLAASLIRAGVDLRAADAIIGTSAGASVGARIALGMDLSTAPSSVMPGPEPTQAPPTMDGMAELMAAVARASTSTTPEHEWAKAGAMALAADTVSEARSLSREPFTGLVDRTWPANFFTTALDAATGAFHVWSAASGAPLHLAVASSCALPGVWPPITIGTARYIDGGVKSMLNADLAVGYSRVVVVSCFTMATVQDGPRDVAQTLNAALHAELQSIRGKGGTLALIEPGIELQTLTRGGQDMLDNSLVPAAYEIGLTQGQAEAERIRRVWQQDATQGTRD